MSSGTDLKKANDSAPVLSGSLIIVINENGTASSTSGAYPIQNNTGNVVPINSMNGSLIINVNNGETGFISPSDVNQVCRYKISGTVIEKVLIFRLPWPFGQSFYLDLPRPRVTEEVAHAPGDAVPAQRLNPDGRLSLT